MKAVAYTTAQLEAVSKKWKVRYSSHLLLTTYCLRADAAASALKNHFFFVFAVMLTQLP